MKLLFVSKNLPNLIKSAGDIRSLNMLKILKEEYELTAVASSADYGNNDLKGINCESYVTGDVCSIVSNKQPDIIILSHWTIAKQYLENIRKISKAIIIIDTIDVEFLRLQRMKDYKGNLFCELSQETINGIRDKELEIYKKADKLIITAEQDQIELEKYLNHTIIMLPCLFFINYQERYVFNHNAYIICNWSHEPNIESTKYLCEKIIPQVDLKLYVVGKHPPQSILNYASDKVIIKGPEYNLNNFLSDMSFCLAPILYGAGMNGKIGEALAFGIPVVTTIFGALPYNLIHKESAMVSNTENEFINSINELLSKDYLRTALRTNGKKLVEKFTIEKWKDSFLKKIK